jgi:hypothetical protein
MNSMPRIVKECERKIEIYKITNIINDKLYIGQAVSHILNHGKYRLYGSEGRFRCHISESKSQKKNQCHYLNNSIRKNGEDNFKVELLEVCDMNKGDELETKYILQYNSLFPNGYNLTTGGTVFQHTEESKTRLSIGGLKAFEIKKLEKYKDIDLPENITDYDKHMKKISSSGRNGWMICINGVKSQLTSTYLPYDETKKMAIEFINKLIEQNKKNKLINKSQDILVAGNSLEP